MSLPHFPPEQVPHLRAGLLAGLCPICGEGPWTQVAIHVGRKHLVGAREIKAALGIPASRSLSSPELRRRAREFSLTQTKRTAALIAAKSRRGEDTEAGAQARAWALHKANRRSADARRKMTDEQVADASARIDAGERYRDVAGDFEMTASGLWHRIKSWKQSTADPRAHTPGARPKPITVAQVLAAVNKHGSRRAAARALGVSQNLIRARLAEVGMSTPPNRARDERRRAQSKPGRH
ncbi:hypothetical protein ACFVVM_33075 [Nocardia sp. NPDC058176]|uniref:hypothetical protein n=1 Tax=Nocardia sp. NPDC058176 TaxID=3346368 RepID=UPI0036DD74CF